MVQSNGPPERARCQEEESVRRFTGRTSLALAGHVHLPLHCCPAGRLAWVAGALSEMRLVAQAPPSWLGVPRHADSVPMCLPYERSIGPAVVRLKLFLPVCDRCHIVGGVIRYPGVVRSQ